MEVWLENVIGILTEELIKALTSALSGSED